MNTMKSPTTSTNVKILRASALCALIAGALLSFPLLSANAQAMTDQISLNRAFQKCWHKKDPSIDNGNIIHLWWCNDDHILNQLFFYDTSTGFIRSSANPSKCIHKKNLGWRTGDVVHLWDCAAGPDENKVFDYDDYDGRIRFRFNSEYCAGVKFNGNEIGTPIVVKQCKLAESYSVSGPKSGSTAVQGSVPCSKVGQASETLVLEVKTGNLQGAGSDAQMLIRIVFDDWDTGVFPLNIDRSRYADGNDVINTSREIPGGCNRKGTNIKSMVIENTGSSGIFSADAWFLESICARSSSESSCGDPLTINRWIYGGGRLTWGQKMKA